MAKALQGDVRASGVVLALYARVGIDAAGDATESINADELDILRRFAPRLLKTLSKKKV